MSLTKPTSSWVACRGVILARAASLLNDKTVVASNCTRRKKTTPQKKLPIFDCLSKAIDELTAPNQSWFFQVNQIGFDFDIKNL